ncbi:MAG: RNA-binding protein [Deltaproteobacteria bacterium]|nr:RNA-binding protein [Deltaproteobacteria bacterium]
MWRVFMVISLILGLSSTAMADWVKGDPLEVKWKGKWYPAKIIAIKGAEYKIHYDGFADSWDEFVKAGRMRPVGGWKVGAELEVKWKGKWYPAKIIATRGAKYKIHYDGFEDSWDELVPLPRMRKK